MKKIIVSLLMAGVITLLAVSPSPQVINIWWVPSKAQVDVYKLYATNDITAPLSSWPLLTTVSGAATNVLITMVPQKMFFYATSSNFWGESGSSNVTNTPDVATNVFIGLTK